MKRKIVFVIVEGPSDDEALSLLLERIYERENVYVYIAHCDITTSRDSAGVYVRGSSICRKVSEIVRTYMSSNHFSREHFREIIHLIDMDGAYIPDEAVVYSGEKKSPFYSSTSILTDRVSNIIKRNHQKRSCLDRLSITEALCGIPYHAYYMSCNLDHVLYDKLNLTDREKGKFSMEFARKYRDRTQDFISFISDSDFSVKTDYVSSWHFIKEGLHSLERHTNFGLGLDRALEPYL